MSTDHPTAAAPVNSLAVPRFVGIPTFMRLPYQPDLEGIDIAVCGVPFDFPSGRGQARLGPSQIRDMSRYIRKYNNDGISPYDLCRIADVGDCSMDPFSADNSADITTEFINAIADRGIAVVAAGGDHGATYPILRGVVRDGPIGLIHFDAHPDTYDVEQSVRVNHGNLVLLGVQDELLDPARVITIGIRGTRFSADDRNYHADHGMRLVTTDDVADRGVADVVREIREVIGAGPAYLTFDIDALDPAYAIGTGAPEPDGLTMREALRMVRGCAGLDVIGGDVCEVSPPFDTTGHTALNAANLMFEILCLTAQAIAAKRQP